MYALANATSGIESFVLEKKTLYAECMKCHHVATRNANEQYTGVCAGEKRGMKLVTQENVTKELVNKK